MTDMNAIRQEAERLNGNTNNPKVYTAQPQTTTTCQCGERSGVFEVKKPSPNKGRLFASCDHCNRFQWLDLPLCATCRERKYKATCRKGKHAGRPFLACPNRCKGAFEWLDEQ